MAKSKKSSKSSAAKNRDQETSQKVSLGNQLRLGTGTFFLLAGVFICLSIISYCFTWQIDQDKLLSASGSRAFLFHSNTAVANWGGRLGAVVAHELVFKGAGIASFVLGLWITGLGLNLVYGRRVVPVIRYLRWTSILLLICAPLLTYLMPNASFPFGGAWGTEAVSYLQLFLGTLGTGMLLAAICLFFIFIIFALDIRPLLSKARMKAQTLAASLATSDNEAPATTDSQAEHTHTQLRIEEDDPLQRFGMTVTERSESTTPSKPAPVPSKMNENDPVEEDEEILVDLLQEEENLPEASGDIVEDDDNMTDEPELSLEVTHNEEASVIKNGGHISIEDDEPYAPELDLPSYKFPTLDLLEDRAENITLDKEELEKNKTQIIQTLRSFGIEIQRISATVGPTVTLYEIVPAEGVRISKIRNLEDDIALNLAALGIRIIAPIPGKGTIGIEVPNANKQIVSMRALLASGKFVNSKMSLPIALGKKIDNENYIVDLATMPHLLVAGATGQGKSVGINAILVSLLYKKHPSQLKFVMVDPKKVELSIYRTIEKHFLAKLPNEEEAIITDTKKVIYTLNALCIEMDNRYELLKEAGSRNIKEYNEKFIKRKLSPERGHKYLPFIVLVIDEFADLIMTAGKEVEMPIARLAQLARAVGIHLIIATQRPSVNVITGTIKANFPARIAFKVSAKVDSRTILDAGGAEQLIGRGDMLVSHGSELLRLQCAFVDTPEVEEVVDFIGAQRGYPTAFELPEYEGDDDDSNTKVVDLANRDKLFGDCARVVVQTQSGSTSMLQRRFNLGYNRAGRIMDQLEAAGIVGPAVGSKPREVLYHTEAELDQYLSTFE